MRLNLNCWDLWIRANEIQICQLFPNLIPNAFQAMEHGGILEIDSTFDDDRVHIHLRDSGSGIPEEIRQRIFEPFFTTKEPGKGTGLGLAVVAQILEDHLGTIRVSSAQGRGTAVHVSLPRSSETE